MKSLVELLRCNWLTNRKRQLFRYGMYNDLIEEESRCSQLFMFSTADDICDYRSIEEFISKRKEKGVDTTSVIWNDSPHVDHLRNHPEEYTANVHSFLQKCVK